MNLNQNTSDTISQTGIPCARQMEKDVAKIGIDETSKNITKRARSPFPSPGGDAGVHLLPHKQEGASTLGEHFGSDASPKMPVGHRYRTRTQVDPIDARKSCLQPPSEATHPVVESVSCSLRLRLGLDFPKVSPKETSNGKKL